MTRPPLSPRPDLADLEPYISPQRPARWRMNTNESPYPPPPGLVDELSERMVALALNRYPDKDAQGLYQALAEYADWSVDGLWAANGSNEVLMHLFLAYGGPTRTVLTFEPTYSLHSLIPRVAGTRIRNLWRDEDYAIDLEAALEEIDRIAPDIVVVCSPNNPTGNCEALSTVRALLEAAPGIVVVDEAYGEFADPDESVRPLLDEHRNLVLVKTFSKAWRLAGVRLGYMLADPAMMDGIARVRLPYHLSTLTQAVGELALRYSDETLGMVESIIEQRDRLSVELQAMGIKTFPSRANFVLFQADDADAVFNRLLERDVLVRNYSSNPALRGRLRVTAGLREETDAFLEAMGAILDES
ncbi:MAG TPA: histidinol-phosphate transaminase [Actinomycetota bacterium]|nr:histidinol-phosphate transaminase [Actinomycetota bacterium]